MTTFSVSGGYFRLDDQPVFIHAGEFHYFRCPREDWRARLQQLLDCGFNAVAAYIPWLWHQPTPDLMDVDGHSHPLRDLAGFLDLATEMGFWIIPRPGPYIMAETINEGVPPWVFEKYPHASFVNQYGKVENIASYLQPDFLKCVDEWYAAVFAVLAPRQITRGGKIIMIQLDNEMGMIHWVRNIIDTNPDTINRFAEWLDKTYHDDSPYPSLDVPAKRLYLMDRIRNPQPDSVRVIEDYRRFFRVYIREYMTRLWNMARAHGMEVPPVVNIHGFGNGGKTFPIGISQLIEAMEIPGMISATDVYPLHIDEGNLHHITLINEMTKAVQSPEQTLFSIEFQSGGNQDFGGTQSSLYDLHSRVSISLGMRAINHYLFYAGENHPILSPVKRHDWGPPIRKDGTTRRHYHRYRSLSNVIRAYGEALVVAQPKTVTTIGFILDQYMTEVNNEFTRPFTDTLTHQRDVILFDFIARGLTLTHRPFNCIELARGTLDSAKTPILWLMLDKACDAPIQQKLANYVSEGGKLVIVGRLPEETFGHTPCTILRDALGVQIARVDPPFTQTHIHAFKERDIPASFVETYTGEVGEVFATTADRDETVGFIKQVGMGHVMMLGAAFGAMVPEDLGVFDTMATRIGLPRLFRMSDWADVRVSEGDQGSFLYITNFQDDPIHTEIWMQGEPLFNGHTIHLPARRGAILPLHWRMHDGITVHWLTTEPLEISENDVEVRLFTDSAFKIPLAQISLDGYQCVSGNLIERGEDGRFLIDAIDGVFIFKKG